MTRGKSGFLLDHFAGTDAAARASGTRVFDLMMAVYLAGVAALQSTAYWYYTTYFAYAVAAVFVLSLRRVDFLQMAGFWMTVFLLGWMWLTAGLSAYPQAAIPAVWYMAKIVIMGLLILVMCRTYKQLSLYMRAYLIGALIAAAAGAVMGYAAVAETGERLVGIATHENAFGSAIFHGTLAGLILLPMANWFWKLVIWLYYAAGFVSILASGSRGAAVAILVALGAYVFLEYIRNLRANLKILVPVLLVAAAIPIVAVVWFPHSSLVVRMTAWLSGERGADSGRIDIYRHVWEMFVSSPVLGYGLGTFRFHSRYVYTHSAGLELLVSGGLPATVLYYGFCVLVWRALRRLLRLYTDAPKVRKMLNACLASVIAIVAHGVFAVVIYHKLPMFLMCAILGLAVRHLAECRRASSETEGEADATRVLASPAVLSPRRPV